MAKNKIMKAHQEEESFDFQNDMDSIHGEEAMMGMMTGFIEASRHQMQISVELTKLVVEKNHKDSMSETEIFSTFKRASQVVAENCALKDLFEKFR